MRPLSSVRTASTYKKSSIETQPTPATSNWFTSGAAAPLDCSEGLFCVCIVMNDCPVRGGHALDVVNPPDVAADYRTQCSGLHGCHRERQPFLDGFGSGATGHYHRNR